MKNSGLYYLLDTVKNRKNLNLLMRKGFSFKTIGELTEAAAQEGLVSLSENSFELTPAGQEMYLSLSQLNKKTNKEEWIEEEVKSKIAQIDSDFIYLPSQNDTSFWI